MSKLTPCWPPVGWVSYFSRPTVWGEVGEGNFGYLLALRGQERRPFPGPSCVDRYGRYHVTTWNCPSLSHASPNADSGWGMSGNSWLMSFASQSRGHVARRSASGAMVWRQRVW